MQTIKKKSNYPNALRATVFYFSHVAEKQSHPYLLLPIPAGSLLATFSEKIKTSCYLVTKPN